MTPRMDHYCVVDRPKGVPFNGHIVDGGEMWDQLNDYILLHIILTEGLVLYVIAYSPVV